MRVEFVAGVMPALFDNHVAFLSKKSGRSTAFVVRWNSYLSQYFDSCEWLEEYGWQGILHTLTDYGYERVKTVSEVGEFAVKGDTISFWEPGMPDPVRMDFFGDDIEEVNSYDVLTGRKLRKLKNIPVFDLTQLEDKTDRNNVNFHFEDKGDIEISDEVIVLKQVLEDADKKYDFTATQLYFGRFDLLEKDIEKYEEQGYKIKIFTQHKASLPHTLQTYITSPIVNDLPFENLEHIEMGFSSETYKQVIITDRELFGTIFITTRQRKTLKSTEAQKLLSQLEGEIEVGDYIVHEDYGVGVYRGFTVEDEQDYLKIEYANSDELFVPLDQINKLTKFIGEQGQHVEVTRLGKTDWQNLRTKVKKQVAIAAKELARHYAQAELAQATVVDTEDTEEYKDFLDKFEYEETPDQISAEKDIILDLTKKKPMNRLLIGDVGFGKTEIMMRAAYKILEAGKQVVILCPTTVLALQHFNTFSKRFEDTPFNTAILSRHNSQIENKKFIEAVNENKVDLVIGTHRMLSSDFQPKDLGLLIVDEEQRFGVKQKEKIKKLEYGVHTLYVSATPIPRTLSMALSAIKDISLIQTPPKGRRSVETEVSKLSWTKIASAMQKELERGGQVLFIHNEISSISSVKAKLETLLPKVTLDIGHGQMTATKLDDIMTRFYEGKTDCLIATTIVENGLDIPNVNTIIVNQAQKLGLAQMYQLRGRVGRSDKQAYAYFFYKGRDLPAEGEILDESSIITDQDEVKTFKLKPAKYIARLETILNAQELGAGFKIASRDLEIRGAGNLLGREQSGSISKIGYGLYMQMLAEEIEKLKA